MLYELTYAIFYWMQSDSGYYQVWIIPFMTIGMIARQTVILLRKKRKQEINEEE